MKSVFDQQTRDELINRINSLNENSTAQWGKMNVYQMVKHCIRSEEMYLGKVTYKQTFLGRLFGKWAMKDLLKGDGPVKQGLPTVPSFKVTERSGPVIAERDKWIGLLKEYANFSNPGAVHPFFGYMNREQIGLATYKHINHHLRQFNC